jgi:branched chain amino acid efflux pump
MRRTLRCVVRNALGIGVATGAYGVSFGALAIAAGLSVPQACALSLLMFTGASQFAFVGLIGAGAFGAVASALLLGARNGLYGLRLAPMLPRRAAHLVIDESAAMAMSYGRRGFWATGLSVFACWNAGTLAGALAGTAVSDPRTLGLDAAAPAAFVALVAPRLDSREPRAIAAAAALAALIAVPLTPAGVPVLVAAAVAVALASTLRHETPAAPAPASTPPAHARASAPTAPAPASTPPAARCGPRS